MLDALALREIKEFDPEFICALLLGSVAAARLPPSAQRVRRVHHRTGLGAAGLVTSVGFGGGAEVGSGCFCASTR